MDHHHASSPAGAAMLGHGPSPSQRTATSEYQMAAGTDWLQQIHTDTRLLY